MFSCWIWTEIVFTGDVMVDLCVLIFQFIRQREIRVCRCWSTLMYRNPKGRACLFARCVNYLKSALRICCRQGREEKEIQTDICEEFDPGSNCNWQKQGLNGEMQDGWILRERKSTQMHALFSKTPCWTMNYHDKQTNIWGEFHSKGDMYFQREH